MVNYLPLIYGGAAAAAAGIASIYHATYSVRSQWLGRTFWHGTADSGSVALTFDDGPSEDTDAVLDILAQYDVKAAFFVVGQQVEKYPALALRIAVEGHEIGNHSYSHPIYLYNGASETRRQLKRTQEIIRDVTGVEARIARPPCGVRTPAYFSVANDLGLRTIQWSVAGFDWKKQSGAKIAATVLKKAEPGAIILLHDGDSENKNSRQPTVDALPLIIDGLWAKGLNIAPLSQMCLETGGSTVTA